MPGRTSLNRRRLKRNDTKQKRKEKIALIHIAKKQVGLDDAAYRALLSGVAGIESLTELAGEKQFRDIMDAFQKLGFVNRKPLTKPAPPPETVWGGSEAQRKKIQAMWKTCARCKTDAALRKFIKRITGVDSPRFLNIDLSRKVILALEKMMVKAGFDPQTGVKLDQMKSEILQTGK